MFDDISLSENKFTDQGYQQGLESGLKKSYIEGEELGWVKGKQIGAEIGFYTGFVSTYRLKINSEISENSANSEAAAKKKTDKILAALNKLETLTVEFPDYNSKEGFEEKLEEIRAKFKLVCSLLKISSEFGVSQTTW